MSTFVAAARQPVNPGTRRDSNSGFTLAAAVLGFFVITLDAVVVNVALPSIRETWAAASPGCSGWSTGTR
jgi:hypothetical protein